jgi:hypothetical protein
MPDLTLVLGTAADPRRLTASTESVIAILIGPGVISRLILGLLSTIRILVFETASGCTWLASRIPRDFNEENQGALDEGGRRASER